LYWAALYRDLPFSAFGDDAVTGPVKQELEKIDNGRFVKPLFGSGFPRTGRGDYVSQFLLNGVRLNRQELIQTISCPTSSSDFSTTLDQWFSCQNGVPPEDSTKKLESPRFVFNGRALAELVRDDFSFQAFLWAALIIQSWGSSALSPGLPGRYIRNSTMFVNRGWPHIFALIATASRALEDAWFWKWRIFRRLRPEELAGRICLAEDGVFRIGSCADFSSLQCVKLSNTKFGSSLLPLAYPEGAPLHPSFPAGHAEVAGACVTILKAFTDPDFLIPAPVAVSDDGRELLPRNISLSIEGELNKLAWNMAFGRSFAGIHYRSDNEVGLRLGENIALQLLRASGREQIGAKSVVWLRRFDGNWVSVEL
jgi:hypothetical protein